MTDSIENLGERDEYEGYEPPSNFARPPEPKEYTFMRSTDEGTWKASTYVIGKGENTGLEVAKFRFRGLIQGGLFDGRIAFGSIDTQTSSWKKFSSVTDFIFAAKSSFRPKTAELIAAVKEEKPTILERIVGPFNARTNWEWFCKECGETFLSGYKNPKSPKKYEGPKVVVAKNVDGSTNHAQKCPGCQAEIGATLIIAGFVVPKSGAVTITTTRGLSTPANLPPVAG